VLLGDVVVAEVCVVVAVVVLVNDEPLLDELVSADEVPAGGLSEHATMLATKLRATVVRRCIGQRYWNVTSRTTGL